MEASAEMKWGLICSVDDQENMKDYIDFSIWMVKQLEISASKLQLGHKFVEMPTFVLHAIPGSIDQSRECYETIAKQHPQVIYVIHILPSKDSLEYQVLKEHTLAGALVGQGVLADNALAYFKCYELDEVMANMNQWIGRRLAQITARRTAEDEDEGICEKEIGDVESDGQKTENNKKINIWVPPQNKNFNLNKNQTNLKQMPKNVQIQRNYSINNNQKYIRKDNYRLTVATGANATNLFGGEMTTNFDRRSPSFNTNNDFEHSVDVVLHSSSLHSNLGAPQQTNNNRSFNSREKNTSCNEIGIEREKEVLVKGYPPNFNKFQIASLFSDFRPLNVQYMESGESIVQFVNKFHAVQVIEKYNGRKYEDEGFTLQVRSAAKEDPTKQIGAVKTKLASLLLMITTAKAVGKENVTTTSEEDKEGW